MVMRGLDPRIHCRGMLGLMPYYVYIMASRRNGTLHVGVTNHLVRRVYEHREHLADGFIFHCRKLKNGGKIYADEAEYQEWQDAIANVTKAAGLLRFFIDDSIDESEPFGAVRQRATSIIAPKDIEAVCLYLADQKRSQGYYIWEYYDRFRREL